ncbi:MAG: hypothetical protein LUH15_08555 [Tannerellaceae bacterium]|nr:hypothetical protein [Tannerellaceae bacterium]
MKRIVGIMLLFTGFLSAYTQTTPVELELEQGMPEFSIMHDNGSRLTINPYLNKIILIVF